MRGCRPHDPGSNPGQGATQLHTYKSVHSQIISLVFDKVLFEKLQEQKISEEIILIYLLLKEVDSDHAATLFVDCFSMAYFLDVYGF